MLETIFDLQDITLLKNISKVINSFGCGVYLVGGIVRDILLGIKPKDIDIVVVGDVIEMLPTLKQRLFCKVLKISNDLKTARLEFRTDLAIDFASTRKEIYGERKGIPIAGHFGCKLEYDVLRRDFSVNALAISLNNDNFGKVIDFVGGQEDLKNKKLRVLHDKSFEDDPTRIIRAFKFAHRLGFSLEDKTKELKDKYLENRDYTTVVSPARIKKELYEIFSLNSAEVMNDFIDQKIYKVLSNDINDVEMEDIKELIDKYNITENIEFLYFAAIFFKKENFRIIRQFDLTRQEIKMLQDLKFTEKLDGKLSDLEIHQQYSARSKASLALEYLLKNNSNLKRYLDNLNSVKIEVTSEDLLMMGVPESRSFSLIFNKLLEAKIKGELPDKSSELRFVRKLIMNNEV